MASKLLPGLLAIFPIPMWACSCVTGPYCQQAPDPGNQQQAVFVGVVRDFYPQSRGEMDQLHEEFYRNHPELIPQPGNLTGRRVASAPPDDQEFRREFIRFLWGDDLNPVEQEQLRDADRRQLDRLMFDYRRRARLRVLENFNNADGSELELFTNLDGPSCGFDFVPGQTYLVEAFRSGPEQRWTVSSCRAPRLVSSATDDLNALRAWKAGQAPKVRIRGGLFSRDGRQSPAGVKLQLLGSQRALETISGPDGQFEFQDLAAGRYQLVWGAAAPQSRSMDLTGAWCARVQLPLGRP